MFAMLDKGGESRQYHIWISLSLFSRVSYSRRKPYRYFVLSCLQKGNTLNTYFRVSFLRSIVIVFTNSNATITAFTSSTFSTCWQTMYFETSRTIKCFCSLLAWNRVQTIFGNNENEITLGTGSVRSS